MTQFPQGEYHIFSNPIINILATSPSNRPLLLTTTLIICSSFRTKSTFFCVVREARTALWFLQVSLALSYESLVVMNFRQELPTRCQLSPHTFSAAERVDVNTSDTPCRLICKLTVYPLEKLATFSLCMSEAVQVL